MSPAANTGGDSSQYLYPLPMNTAIAAPILPASDALTPKVHANPAAIPS